MELTLCCSLFFAIHLSFWKRVPIEWGGEYTTFQTEWIKNLHTESFSDEKKGLYSKPELFFLIAIIFHFSQKFLQDFLVIIFD